MAISYLWKARMMEQMARMNDESLSRAKVKRAYRLAMFYFKKSLQSAPTKG